VIYILGSLGCLLATDVWTFLLFRTIQAAIVSGFALSRVIIRDTEPAQKAAGLMGYLSIAWAIAPMLAPMLGGALDLLFGWRANFIAFLVFGAAVLALCWLDLGETNKNPSETFTKQFKSFPSLFRSRPFWGYSLCMAFSMGALYAFLAAAPLVATAVLRMSPATLGIYMGSTAAGFILGSFVSGRFAAHYPLTNDDRCRQGCCLCRIDRGPGFATRRNRARVFLVRLVRVSRLSATGYRCRAVMSVRCQSDPSWLGAPQGFQVHSPAQAGP
jgi:predicted MFS family arabinose efflux permease